VICGDNGFQKLKTNRRGNNNQLVEWAKSEPSWVLKRRQIVKGKSRKEESTVGGNKNSPVAQAGGVIRKRCIEA
jgi:hypothetical protein